MDETVEKTAMKKRRPASADFFAQALQHHQSGRWAQAEQAYRSCLTHSPSNADAHINLAGVLRRQGQTAAALEHLQTGLRLAPHHAAGWYNLGNLYRELNQLPQAANAYRQALQFAPQDAPTWYNLGLTLAEINQDNEAKRAYLQALTFDPAHLDARLNLAVLLSNEGKLSAAHKHLQDLLAQAPDYAPALTNLANVYKDMGQIEAAIATLKRVAALQPDLPQARSNLLLNQQYQASGAGETRHELQQQAAWRQYQDGVSADTLLAEAKAWGEWATGRAGDEQARPAARPLLDPNTGQCRPLRVGYVSADLSSHPVGLFLKEVLAAHAPEVVLPFAYSNGATTDAVTCELQRSLQQFHGGPQGWRDVRGLDDTALAAQIRNDGIDLLVDLSGHTAKTRLAMFAHHPAPVQVSWLGYFATTGLPAVDFVILDPFHAPSGTEAQFTETIVRLPHNRFCYTPVAFAPAVSPAPTFTNGHITFGSFNNTAKLNPAVLAAWADILNAVPGSRLVLKWLTLADQNYREELNTFFRQRGIDDARIELRGRSNHEQVLAEYADVDIALDPFPFSGGQTSCEALWMGVPIITWPQERLVSRQTWSFLANIGLPELAADSPVDYVSKAVALAHDRPRLAALRNTLRERMATSPLCDVTGFTRELETAYRTMWQHITGERLPGHAADDLNEQGAACLQAGQVEAAVARFEQALLLNSRHVPAHYNLGNARRARGEHEAAVASYRRALALAPQLMVAYNNLGNALRDLGRPDEAVAALQQAVTLQPDYAVAHNNLGSALFELRRFAAAADSFRAALSLQPDFAIAHKNLGDVHKEMGDYDAAVAEYRQALALGLTNIEAINNLGIALRELGQYEEAMACYRQAIERDPTQAAPWCNLGLACHDIGRLAEGEAYLRHALSLKPDFAIAHANLGSLLKDLGRYEEAIACFDQALRHDPEHVDAYNNRLFALQLTGADPKAALAAARDYGNWVRSCATTPFTEWLAPPNPGRPLTIGWISGDLRRHPVGYFLESVWAHLRQQQSHWRHVAYASYFLKDALTTRLKTGCSQWHEVIGWNDEQLARQIHADQIDILIDLAGHTAHNRLPVFAWKPAPVQVTWLGYFATTGVKEIDWLIADPYTLPESEEAYFTENIWRLPETRLCFTPPQEDIRVNELPAIKNGYVTFGCFNNLAKMNDAVVATWAKILQSVPTSHLFLKTKQLADAQVREHTLSRFAAHGIAAHRISLEGPTPRTDYLAAYQRIDLALDPFPYPGGTTTVEALWMGVPVLTLAGERFLSRQGVGLLMNAGLPEWVASDPEDYLARAITHAADLQKLAALRQMLRPQLLASPLCDAPRFADHFADALRGMWQAWCASTTIEANSDTSNRQPALPA